MLEADEYRMVNFLLGLANRTLYRSYKYLDKRDHPLAEEFRRIRNELDDARSELQEGQL